MQSVKTLITLGTAFMLIVLFVCAEIYGQQKHMEATRLPANMNLKDFLDERPNPIAVYKFYVQERVFIFIQGTYPPGDSSFLSLPSGPPAYIFDDTGKLADWTDDNNEGRSFAQYWGSDHSRGGVPTNATLITVAEAKQLIKPLNEKNVQPQQGTTPK